VHTHLKSRRVHITLYIAGAKKHQHVCALEGGAGGDAHLVRLDAIRLLEADEELPSLGHLQLLASM
jgi:hypothetical protein